jgi:hypothetical protein
MKNLLALLTILIATSTIPARAQQIPAVPPKQWSFEIRIFGTTSQPGRDDLQIAIHTNGTLPATMEARRPIYDEQGKMSLKSPVDHRKLSDEAGAAIYAAARAVILSHRLGEAPPVPIRDGDSVEITISSFDRKLSAVFAHSSAGNSAEFTALVKILHANLPAEFLPGIKDHTVRSEDIRRK